MRMRLFVKGSPQYVRYLIEGARFVGDIADPGVVDYGGNVTLVHINNARLEKVVEWFCDPGYGTTAPFPDGALLFYQPESV